MLRSAQIETISSYVKIYLNHIGFFRNDINCREYSLIQFWQSQINEKLYFPKPLIMINIVLSIIFNSII